MKWYYKIEGGHTHVRVFLNGAKCGDLCFRNEEFDELQKQTTVEFINEERYSTSLESITYGKDPYGQSD